ncbi:type VI secretion protein [Escherichia marmotae]|uniref:type VI secretion protein n=1 Tax=Escherichia marmotae TaxID=1499973 RepID=UPI0027D1ECF2|nr:type VI secretion protein [Escherichia marmotae]
MGARMSGATASGNMGSREFVKITIDGKVIKGNSKVDNCSDYFEGHCPQAFHAFAGIDGTVFDLINLKLRVTKQIQEVLENFFKRGEKEVVIEILRRESTKSSCVYSSFKVIYQGCRLHDVLLAHDHDASLFLELSFTPEESVSIEMNIPSSDGKSTEKLGPIKYSLYKEALV